MNSQRTRDDIVQAARKAAEQTGSRWLSKREFVRLTGISEYFIYRLFPDGGWSEVVQLAGLERHPQHMRPVSDEQVLEEFHRVAGELGYVPTWSVFRARATVSPDRIKQSFGVKEDFLKRYYEWLEVREPHSPLLQKPRSETGPKVVRRSREASAPTAHRQWPKTSGFELGSPLGFRGLGHAPINENGVIYAFGVVSGDLGFKVDAIRPNAYPDCVARRRTDRTRDLWQQVQIEFEYRSSHFRDQGHDRSKCDIIVCWEHDWRECPPELEVVELMSELKKLEG